MELTILICLGDAFSHNSESTSISCISGSDNAAKAPDGLEQAQKSWCEALLLYNELLAENACCSLAELRIGGGELLAIGFSGRAVGRAKQRLLDEVASERLANEHSALVHRAERLYRSGWRGETDRRE